MLKMPRQREAKREALLAEVEKMPLNYAESGAQSEELGTLAPEAVTALRNAGLFQLKLPAAVGGAEADPVTEMMVLEAIAYHDFTSGWCSMVGATGVASSGAFLPQAGLDRVFGGGEIPTVSISFFPAGRAVRENGGCFTPMRRTRSPKCLGILGHLLHNCLLLHGRHGAWDRSKAPTLSRASAPCRFIFPTIA